MLDALLSEARLRWGHDPGSGLQVIPAERLVACPIDAARPLLIAPLAVLRDGGAVDPPLPLPGRHGPGGDDPGAVLRRLYPGNHVVGRIGRPDGRDVATLAPDDFAGPLYLRPIEPELAAAGPWAMPYIAWRLRLPDGCPWDREQTHLSLRKYLLEEAYEVYDALEGGATPELAEELGDLLLQVILHAELAAEAGVFDLADVQAAIARKIVRRHPHVFGEAVVRTAADVNRQWERIKSEERAAAAAEAGSVAPDGPGVTPRSALDGISRSLPALAASQEMQERAAALGYDWPSIDGILEKVREELAELAAAPDPAARREEFGDLLLVIVNVGRRMGIDSETALRGAADKFRRRFASVERQAAERGVALRDLDFAALDALWDAAKAEERTT
jgi:tetrapyrrole methylase family protein/MazG family protein